MTPADVKALEALRDEMRDKARADRCRQYNELIWAAIAVETDKWADRLDALLQGAGHLPKQDEQPIDLGPHPNCPRCRGTGECSNAQFRCPCRWGRSSCRARG